MTRLTKHTILGTSLGAAAVFFIAGILFWGGFNWMLAATNKQSFCTSCHEMGWVYEEYQQTVHYSNHSGVQAECADCHVPRAWGPKMIRKIQASREVWGKLVGSIRTEERFEAKRLVLAERVWRSMLRTDSLECRNCHNWTAMDLEAQGSQAQRAHQRAFDEGQTCIECHQGIAHELPDGWDQSPVWDDDVDDAPAVVLEDLPEGMDAPASAELARGVNWDGVPKKELDLFFPGQTSIEWMLDGSQHGGGRAFRMGDRCIWCHEDEETDIGTKMVAGEDDLDLDPIPGKRPVVPVTVQAAYDDDHLMMRFQFPAGDHAPVPFVDGGKMAPEVPFRLAVALLDDSVEMASEGGCWVSCHHDSRHMPDHPDAGTLDGHDLAGRLDLADGVTKYLKETREDLEIRGRGGAPRGGWDKLLEEGTVGDLLEQSTFMDLLQYQAAEDGAGRSLSGYVLDQRHLEESPVVDFQSELQDGTWTVWMTRALRPGTEGDKGLRTELLYNIGIAIHDDYSKSRFHHVSWQYLLGFDHEEAEINAVRQ